MGFNFQAGHPTRVYREGVGARVVSLIHSEIGASVPLGDDKADPFVVMDELGWSWWSDLQSFAVDKLGESQARQISAVDAWNGVYLQAEVDRVLLWPDGKPQEPSQPRIRVVHKQGDPWHQRLLRFLKLKRKDVHGDILQALQAMRDAYGARAGETGALQVGSLVSLKSELDGLLEAIGIESTEAAVEARRSHYADSQDRMDDDPHIQCLCHAWLTADYAITHGSPLWLIT